MVGAPSPNEERSRRAAYIWVQWGRGGAQADAAARAAVRVEARVSPPLAFRQRRRADPCEARRTAKKKRDYGFNRGVNGAR
jgi:hypothetical protein